MEESRRAVSRRTPEPHPEMTAGLMVEPGLSQTCRTKARPSLRKVWGHELYLGDCLDVLGSMPDDTADVIVTSPPYNIGLQYNTHHDRMSETEYLDWMVLVSGELHRVMKQDGSFFLNIAGSPRNPWIPFELATRLRHMFVLQNHISWVKSIAIGDRTHGHFKPINSPRFINNNHEHVFHFTRAGNVALDRLAAGVPYTDKSNIGRRGHARDRRCRGDTWYIPYETVRSRRGKHDHPATFPVALPERCIQLHGKKHAVVLDPFM